MKLTYRPEIDGLRFLAVISVILYHLNLSDNKSIFDSGYLGVDIFFVISGFLISKIIFSELLETKKFNFKLFYEKRARRILPVLIIVVLFSLIPSLFLLLPNSLIDFSKSIFFSLIFNSNLYFHFTGLIYGAEAGLLKPFLHTWTLSVEEQFYIFAPILIVIIFKFLRQKIFLITFLFFFISLILSYYGSLKHPSFNFYFVATRAWEIIFGSMLALIDIKYKSQITLSKSKYFLDYSMPKLGFLLIILSFIIFDKNTNHPSFITLLPVIGTGLIIFFFKQK